MKAYDCSTDHALVDGNPHWRRAQAVADRFFDLDHEYPMGRVDMSHGCVDTSLLGRLDHFCGTPACHAGWYLLSKKKREGEKEFDLGATAMARDLGFLSRNELGSWAHRNPEIWGNEDGVHMFMFSQAFGERVTRLDINLKTIARHWQGVADRLKALQEGA
jgi:hypothetical protein